MNPLTLFRGSCQEVHGGLVKRVEEFVMPSLNLNNNKVEEIPNVRNEPSDLIKQL